MDPEQKLTCKADQARRDLVLKRPGLNGIDFIEVDAADHRILRVVFLKPVGPLNPVNPADPNDEFGLSTNLAPISISGGVRIVGIQPASLTRLPDGSLRLVVDRPGDFSTYTLIIQITQLDRRMREADFSFMASCPSDFDCREETACPPQPVESLALDYDAKDYASFRQLMLDLLPRLNPGATERSPADLEMALVELLAYRADHLSYFQDAVANEAYLATARQRTSVRRLAKLIDYRMHDGRNACTWVHVAVSAVLNLDQGTKVVSRITAPLKGEAVPPGPVVNAAAITADALETDAALAEAVVFETTHKVRLDPASNSLNIHTWGNDECCLAPGTTEIFVYSIRADQRAIIPPLQKGDFVLFEEVKGPLTGLEADADPKRRQVVRLDRDPAPDQDPLFSDITVNGIPQPWAPGETPLPLLRLQWGVTDALSAPFCISARPVGMALLRNVTLARGNIVLADHGLTVTETIKPYSAPVEDPNFGLALSKGPLTMQAEPPQVSYNPTTLRLATERTDLAGSPREAMPAVALAVTFDTETELWTPARDLLGSSSFDTRFVTETDNSGRAVLRFGDDEYGRSAVGALSFRAVYRIGTGTAGAVGAEALTHLALSPVVTDVARVRNPLAATGAVEPETLAEVRQWAPQAFRAGQFRAVTESDYVAIAARLPEVRSAVASFRWTGSWYTVFLGIQPRDPSGLVQEPNGVNVLSESLRSRVEHFLDGYRVAGYDLEIRPPQFLPIEIDLQICAAPGYFRSDVEQAVLEALSSRVLPDGRRGFFAPGEFVLGQPLYLSAIYAAVEAVEGVDSAVVSVFRRFGEPDNGELANAVIPVTPWQIVRLDNDANFREHGVLKVSVLGGKL